MSQRFAPRYQNTPSRNAVLQCCVQDCNTVRKLEKADDMQPVGRGARLVAGLSRQLRTAPAADSHQREAKGRSPNPRRTRHPEDYSVVRYADQFSLVFSFGRPRLSPKASWGRRACYTSRAGARGGDPPVPFRSYVPKPDDFVFLLPLNHSKSRDAMGYGMHLLERARWLHTVLRIIVA